MYCRSTDGSSRPWPSTATTEEFTTREFLDYLASIGSERRVAGYRWAFSSRERVIYISYYPDEVPLVNGEYEHLALTCADLAG